MRQYFFLFIWVCLSGLSYGGVPVHFRIESLPAGNPAGSRIFLAGSFNRWNPHDTLFLFKPGPGGAYELVVDLDPGSYEYKATRGDWEKSECRKDGGFLPNRIITVSGDTIVSITIAGWADLYSRNKPKSTAGKNVHVVDTAFRIPQLNRKRRIWICLPDGYEQSSLRYPVLYMHDGQNLFDDLTSFSGEWGVDECIDSMRKKCIVVGIDNDGRRRMNEYGPYDMDRFGEGEGDAYVDFLVRTLKPFIDSHYRTRPGRKHTFIAGSSMGGLISMYAVLKYPRVFGGAGIFSPAFWVAPKIFDDMKTAQRRYRGKLYFYAGTAESETMVPLAEKARDYMKKYSRSSAILVIRAGGQHNESRWRTEFPAFYQWIMN